MPVEIATYVSDLVSSNPVGAIDSAGQGDDHIRTLKLVLQNTFPNANKMFRFPTCVAPIAGNYTVQFPDDMNKLIPINAEAASRTVTLPVPAGTHADGFRVIIVKADHSDFPVTISGGTINGFTVLPLFQRYQRCELIWNAASSEWFADREGAVPIGTLAPFSDGFTAPAGEWLYASNKTIGNVGSGATSAALALCRGLFYHLWNRFSDAICPVSGGRGGSAAADFNIGKTIQLLDMRGYVWAGLDNIDGADAGRLSTANTPGLAIGVESANFTIVQANLPNITLVAAPVADHQHGVDPLAGTTNGAGQFFHRATAANPGVATLTAPAGAHGHNVPLGGSDTPITVNKLQPTRTGGWIIKL